MHRHDDELRAEVVLLELRLAGKREPDRLCRERKRLLLGVREWQQRSRVRLQRIAGQRYELSMSLVTCTECGSTVSDKAAACPKCGAPQRASAGTLTHPTKHSSPMPLWLGMTILGVLMAGVLGGLVFYSKRADPGQRSTTAAAAPLPAAAPPAAAAVEQPAPAPVEQPRVPWADRADTAVTKMLSTDGATLAKGIKRIIHPMGPSDATLAGFDVRRAGSGLSVQLTISWSGGLGLGGYTTIVVWNFDRRHHGQATVYNDSSPFAAKNAAELDQYFRDQIYPSVMTSIGD